MTDQFNKRFTLVVVSTFLLILALGYIYAKYCEAVAIEAIKAGLVQQKVPNGYIWVKPEDYKPYPLSSFDAPHWSK